jgi:Calcineurin-like phosphoesterase
MRRLLAVAAVLVFVGACGVIYLWAPWRSEPAVRAPSGPYVPSGPDERALLWAVGDGADGGAAARAVVERMKRKRFDRVLYLGDVYGSGLLSLLTGDGTAADYRENYDPVYGELAAKTAPTPGNHEWRQRGEGYEPYWEKVFGRPPPAYYAFEVAGWQLLSLNSEAPHGAGSAQVRWLRGQLRAPGTCRLAFWHAPRFSAGSHGDQLHVEPLWNALRGRATIVVSGHDHNMQRLEPADGLTQYVAGAGGHTRYALPRDPRLAFGHDRDYGALRIELSPGRARSAFVTADGRILDLHTVRCTAPNGA